MKRFFGLLFSLFITLISSAQPICQIKEYFTNSGLSQDIISCFIQDSNGFIWVSTRGGLNKFDGYTFKTYKASPYEEHSLTNNRITSIAETKYGDIWCQTYDNKAYIFDTHNKTFFNVLQSTEKDIKRNNLVQRIYSLPKGVAWVVCDEGYCYRIDEGQYKNKESITLYSTFNGSLKGDHILHIFQDSNGDEWILTDGGITIIGDKKIDSNFPFKQIREYEGKFYLTSTSEKLACYDPQTEHIKFIETPAHINQISSFTPISEHTLALATNHGVVLFKTEEGTFKTIDIRTPTQPSNQVVSIYEDQHKELWIQPTSLGVIRINPATGEKQHLYTPQKEVIQFRRDNTPTIFEDIHGTLWITPLNGNFSYYDRETKQLKHFYTEPDNPQSLFAPLIRYRYQDRQGNIWLASARGIIKMSFSPQTCQLKHIDHGFEIRAFLLDSLQRFWIASKSGYVRIYDKNGDLLGYLSPQGKITPTKTLFSTRNNCNIYCLTEDKNGNIWMGSKEHGLFQLTKRADDSYTVRQYTHQPNDPFSLSHDDIFSIHIDSRDNIWVGCYGGGINLIEKDANGSIRFINHNNKLRGYPVNRADNVRYITEAENGVMLLGTTHGLITFSNIFEQPEEIRFYRNKPQTAYHSGLIGSDILHIFIDSQKDIYALTFTGGINKIISDNLLSEEIRFKHYTTQDGLNSELVLSMIEDHNRNLWIASEDALSRFNPETETFDNYDASFLPQKFNFTEAVATKNAKNQLVFGTDIGALEITPEQMKKSSFIPPIALTDIKINGEPLNSSVNNLNKLTLNPSERNISISFSALDYARPEDIRYAYYLKGLEEQWNYSDKNRIASYINLPTGEYQLYIKSTNSDGVWVDNARILSIEVLPTFWETPWAWLLYLIAFILFTYAIVYVLFYIYRLRHQVDIEQQVSNIKLRFFTDISHELRTPLTLISSPVTEVLENEPLSPTARQHLTLVHKNTERMLRLVNQILDFRKIQNRKMKILAERTELIAFLMRITESFRLVAEEKQINYTFESEQEELFTWIDRDKLEKIIFNLLSNAFKYTLPKKAVKVSVKTDTDHVFISVIDEGIGIAKEKQNSLFQRFETLAKSNILQPSSGIGLSLVKELVEMHHGNIEVKSQPYIGSEFCVTLPLSKEAYKNDEQVELILTDSADGDQKQTMPAPSENMDQTLKAEDEQTERLSILIVEDNVELRGLLKTILSAQYTVLEASNGKEGLDKALETIPDMIISDVMMPIVDGLEMIKLIKENKDTCHIPTIILSSKSSLDDRIEGVEHGIDDYITKPFSSTYLKTRISALFNQRKLLQEAFLSRLGDSKQDITNWEPSQPEIQSYDEQFMKQVLEFMEEQMDNPELTIDDFANKLILSRTIFYRKLKSIIGITPVDFIRETRLKRATQLIEQSSYNFSQIAYMTGFSDPRYFGKCFKKHTGMPPREYREEYMKKKNTEI